MRFRIPLLCAFAVTLAASCSRSAVMDPVPKAERLSAPPAGASLVYFLRPSDGSGSIRAILLDDEYFVGQLVEKAHIAYLTKPGKHLFSVVSTTVEFWEKDLEPGKTYYVTVRRRKPRHPFVFLEHTEPLEVSKAEWQVRTTDELRPSAHGRHWIEGRRTNIRWMRNKWYGQWYAEQQGAGASPAQ